ncbi:MAG: hypothetical protein IPI35_30655 [Deltaproteobacteria bacterium]|nr:hypothetical protein [Deltaproteobacteria bacterium]
MRLLRPSLLALLAVVACKDGDSVVTDTDTGPSVIGESGIFTDSGGADSDSQDSGGDSGGDDTNADDTGEVVSDWDSLSLSPALIRVDVGATFTARAVLFDDVMGTQDAAALFGVSDATVLSVDASTGLVTALAEGSAFITADAEGLHAEALVAVQADGALTVTVVDGLTGAPIPSARVSYGDTRVTGDADGRATLTVALGAPADISVWVDSGGYIPLSVMGAVPRELTLPLRPNSEESGPVATIGGDVLFDGCLKADWDEAIVGIVGPSLQRAPLFINAEDLLAEDRVVKFYGIDVEIPGNLVVQGGAETYETPAHEGDVALWGFAGPMPISEISAGFADVGQAFGAVLAHLDNFRFQAIPGLSASASIALDQPVRPEHSFDQEVVVELAALPEGFLGNEDVLVMLLEVGEGGMTLTGLGQGTGTLSVGRVAAEAWPVSDGLYALAWAEVGGLGTGGGSVMALVPVEAGFATVTDWMLPPSGAALDAATRALSVTTDAGATGARLYLVGNDGSDRDILLPAGAFTGTVPKEAPKLQLGRTRWDLIAVETPADTYESLLIGGGFAPLSLEANTTRSSGLDATITGS